MRRRAEAHAAEVDRDAPRQRLFAVRTLRVFLRVARRHGTGDLRGGVVVGKLQALQLLVGERAGLVDEVAPLAVVAEAGQVERLAQLRLVLWVLFHLAQLQVAVRELALLSVLAVAVYGELAAELGLVLSRVAGRYPLRGDAGRLLVRVAGDESGAGHVNGRVSDQLVGRLKGLLVDYRCVCC